MTQASDKTLVRKQALAARQALSAQTRARFSQSITQTLINLPQYKDAKCIASYMHYKNEVETSVLHQSCWQDNKTLLLPTISSQKQMLFTPYQASDTLIENQYGILEPKINTQAKSYTASEVDCIIIPLLALTKKKIA